MSEGSFDVVAGQVGDDLVVVLTGELDLASAPVLRTFIDGLEPGPGRLLLDLSGLTFIDSTGIGCLFKLHRRVDDAGGMVVATGPTRAVRRVLEITQMNRLIAIVDAD